MAPAVETRDLTRCFGRFTAVDRLTLTVKTGEVFGLLGSNGAGKSTTIRMLCGLLTPTSGTATVLGFDVARNPEAVKRRVGYMTQQFSLYQDLTVRQNLRFFGGVYALRGRRLAEREAWAVELAGLKGKEGVLAGSLPGGWRQRLALACAVLHRPRMVFLDEPTGSVDPISRRTFWRRIEEMTREGVTVLVTTHYLEEAEHCGRLALMHGGRLVAMGSVAELKEVFAGGAVLEVTCPRPLEAVERLEGEEGIPEATMFGARLHVVVEEPGEGRRRVERCLERDGNVPFTVERIVPSLEDVFLHSIERATLRHTSGPGGANGIRRAGGTS